MRIKALTLCLGLGAGVALSGCATMKQQPVVEQMYEYTYARPLEEIWPEVRRFVVEEGYPLQESPGQYVLLSDWVTSFGESRVASAGERIFVRGLQLNRANTQVLIYRQSRMTGLKGRPSHRERNNASSLMVLTADEVNPLDGSMGAGYDMGTPRAQNRVFTRDVELEWKLLKRLEPQEAQRLEASVLSGTSP
ncbi:hypothetical protein ACN28E_04040 [Archangium lansingense]|uniref:hypothetical protein n=1 Tax=Archangium lansingense TaxID=2995310 RepID=UPI003B7E4C26